MAVEITQSDLYAEFDAETRAFVQERARRIHARLKRTAEDIIAIGQDLAAVNEKLAPHGKFHAWLRAEFDMSRRTAYRFMQVAERCGSCANLAQVSPSAIYLLAESPDDVIQMVETGQIPATIAAIREAKQSTPPVTHVPLYDPDQAGPKGYEFWKAEPITEETRYQNAVDMGTTEYYYADLRRAAFQADRERRETETPAKSATLTVLQSSESNEWFTPAVYVDAARELMGGIDVDPASCEFANRTVRATTYYDITMNGLEREWCGRVWLNPPYGRDGGDSNQEIWSRRLIEQYDAGIVTEAVLLVNAVPGNKWFQPLWRFILCFPDHRIRFYNQETDASQPTHSNALIYLGDQRERFDALFSQFGAVVQRFRS